ncbi:MAG: hypothetical protein PWQ93_203 [Clostridiales bacterium]|nr:hypothetical protein [Clostridiales bacterium]
MQEQWLALALWLFSHGLADFVLQSDKMVTDKALGRWQGYVVHFTAVFATSMLFMHPFLSWRLFVALLLLSLLHIAVDYAGYQLAASKVYKNDLVGFLIDQICHVLFIAIIWLWMRYQGDLALIGSYAKIPWVVASLAQFVDASYIAVMYLYVIFGGGIFMKKMMQLLAFKVDKQEVIGIGRYIGMLERAIIATLVLFNAMTAMAFVLTAKSLARYSELDNKCFAEYYLVGTLMSTLLALIGGVLGHMLLIR